MERRSRRAQTKVKIVDVPLTDIPEHASLVLDIEVTVEELKVIFGELKEFEANKPESFEAKIRLQKLGETIRLAGDVWVELAYRCGRCLVDRVVDVHGEMEYMLVSREKYESKYHGNDEVELTLADLDVDFFDGEDIDLRPFMREAIILALPHTPTCALIDEQEACDEVFETLVSVSSSDEDEVEDDGIDPRWAPLMALKKKVTDADN